MPLAMQGAAPDFAYPYDAAHVVLLEAAAETGIVGFLCYLAILVGPWVAVARSRGRWTPALVATSATLASVTVVGLFDHYPWTSQAGRIWAWTALGLWVLAYGAIRGARVPERQRA
jgi:O-antigen ligase